MFLDTLSVIGPIAAVAFASVIAFGGLCSLKRAVREYREYRDLVREGWGGDITGAGGGSDRVVHHDNAGAA